MYTQCSQCHTAYEIGPEDLRQAHGRARCGKCGAVFDALASLSHEPPAPGVTRAAPENVAATGAEPDLEPAPESGPEPEATPVADSEPQPEPGAPPEAEPGRERDDEPEPPTESETHIESEAGPEPGAQPERGPEPESGSESETEAEPETETGSDTEAEPEGESGPEPQRFDDNTPLEEVLASLGGELADEEKPGAWEEDGPRAAEETSADEDEAAGEERETSGDLGDEDEWRALLAELDLAETTLVAAGDAVADEEQSTEASADAPEQTAAQPEPETRGPEAEEQSEPAEAAEPDAGPAAEEDELREEPSGTGEQDDLAVSAALFDELVQSGQFTSVLGPDTEAAGQAIAAEPEKRHPAGETAGEPETAATRSTAAEAAAVAPEPAEVTDDAARRRDDAEDEAVLAGTLLRLDGSRRSTIAWSAAALALVLLLGAQVIHGQRAQLATLPDFGPRLQKIYGAFGAELQPRWDIGAFCVESSSGDAGDDALRITSVVVHRGDRPQPYPLLHVALTDRWQSVIGSRTLEAADYLPADLLRDVRVRPGDRIRASALLADPGSEAAGYELHVCYRDGDGGLRCSGACL